jgi:hypothetical protein
LWTTRRERYTAEKLLIYYPSKDGAPLVKKHPIRRYENVNAAVVIMPDCRVHRPDPAVQTQGVSFLADLDRAVATLCLLTHLVPRRKKEYQSPGKQADVVNVEDCPGGYHSAPDLSDNNCYNQYRKPRAAAHCSTARSASAFFRSA